MALALSLACPAAASAAARNAGPWGAEAARYGVSSPIQHMVTMSDGVQLAASTPGCALSRR